jgi:hypothetical protein
MSQRVRRTTSGSSGATRLGERCRCRDNWVMPWLTLGLDSAREQGQLAELASRPC